MREKFVQSGQGDRRFRMPRGQSGFYILEMLHASAVLMVGIVSVVQLVPASLQLNANNRLDTLATVIAQRELDQMLGQPLWVDTFLDENSNHISLGGPNAPGASVVKDYVGAEQIDFNAALVVGFSIPNYADPSGATFDVRWHVLPQVVNGGVISRRIIIGCRKTNATGQLQLPVTLDTWVQK